MSLGGEDFERWWPEVARRLARALARRGVPGADAEDIVQETALRALAAAPPVSSPEGLLRWSFTVARRIEIDRGRRRGRTELLSVELARSRPAGVDTARAAESRVALAAAARGLATLSDTDRAALLGVLTDDEPALDRRQAVRQAVRRHRARTRLVAVVGKLVGVGVAAGQGLRRLAARLRPTHVEVGVVAVAVGVLLLPASTPGSTAAPLREPVVVPAAAVPVSPVDEVAAARSRADVARTASSPPVVPPATVLTTAAASGGRDHRPPTTIPVGPDHMYLPVVTSGSSRVDPNRPIVCAFNEPEVDCVKDTVRLRSANL